MAGEGTQGNPWEQFGKPNTDAGDQPQGDKKAPETVAVPAAEYAQLKTDLKAAQDKIAKIPDDFEGMSRKIGIVDKLVKALTGEGDSKDAGAYKAVFSDLKEVARHAAPGFYKVMQILEENPDAVDQLSRSVDSLHADRVVGLNAQAHKTVMEAAKNVGLRAGNDEALAKMVFPFETSITAIINSNKDLKQAFLQGNVSVVEDIFKQLYEPYKQENLRRKKERMDALKFPKAPPRGSAEPGATGDDKGDKRPDIRTPKGRAEFHKGAVNRWLSKMRGGDEE